MYLPEFWMTAVDHQIEPMAITKIPAATRSSSHSISTTISENGSKPDHGQKMPRAHTRRPRVVCGSINAAPGRPAMPGWMP
jgi:hypothetical protein